MKKVGIWIDKDKANIVMLDGDQERFSTINSEVDYYKATANKTIGGASEIAKDRKLLERKKHQIKSYFSAIAAEISDADAIVIFGPAQMGEKFKKKLDKNYNSISPKVKRVVKTHKMTDNQTKAWVKDFFNTNN